MKAWRHTLGLALTLLTAAALGLLGMGRLGAQTGHQPVAGAEHVRGVEQTLLTFPEWYLVFSPQEYADFIAEERPSEFPYFGHIEQFWQSYAAVTAETNRRGLELNPGYHVMIMVIGVSTTVEYALRSAYELLIGRLTEALASEPTDEEKFAADVAQEYVDFIRERPWYEFDFASRLRSLWTDTGFAGPDLLRKWERKFVLSTEYGIKMLYGQLIKFATGSVYEAAAPVTSIVTRPVPAPDPRLPELKIVQTLPDGRALITVPRYEAFMHYAQALANKEIFMEEIAGNRSLLLVSLHTTPDWLPSVDAPVLLRQPILTDPGRQRVVVMIAVSSLSAKLRYWKTQNVQVEHVFDY